MSVGKPITLESSLHPFFSLLVILSATEFAPSLECTLYHPTWGYHPTCLTKDALTKPRTCFDLIRKWCPIGATVVPLDQNRLQAFPIKGYECFPISGVILVTSLKARTNSFSPLFQMNKLRQRSGISLLDPHMESHSPVIKKNHWQLPLLPFSLKPSKMLSLSHKFYRPWNY